MREGARRGEGRNIWSQNMLYPFLSQYHSQSSACNALGCSILWICCVMQPVWDVVRNSRWYLIIAPTDLFNWSSYSLDPCPPDSIWQFFCWRAEKLHATSHPALHSWKLALTRCCPAAHLLDQQWVCTHGLKVEHVQVHQPSSSLVRSTRSGTPQWRREAGAWGMQTSTGNLRYLLGLGFLFRTHHSSSWPGGWQTNRGTDMTRPIRRWIDINSKVISRWLAGQWVEGWKRDQLVRRFCACDTSSSECGGQVFEFVQPARRL